MAHSASHPHRPLKYRKDIEGLRGVALLLVMAYHLGLPPVSGGYIGVDIFFVISGYLITSVLQSERAIVAPLANFYTRRMKRLLPMFVVFAAVTSAVSVILLLPEDLIGYFKSLRAALLFKSNAFFDVQTKDYFGPNARELPLLHTWSLSIEWQFYLLFPLLYLTAQARLSERFLKIGLLAVAIALALFSVFITHDSSNAYFLTSARFFELLFGACVTQFNPHAWRRLGSALVLPCVGLLCGLAVLFTPGTTFPGANAVLVCLLTAVVVFYGEGNQWLSNKWLVHVGRISYSAYLWHWPFIAFLTYLHIAISPLGAAMIVAIVLSLSHLSYNLVEEPCRQSRMRFGASILTLFIAPISMIALALTVTRSNDGFPQRLGAESIHAYNLLRPYESNNQRQCHDFNGRDIEECAFGDLIATTQALMLGDSHARHYWWFVDVLAKRAHVKVIGLSYGECLMLPGASGVIQDRAYPECTSATARNFEIIRRGGFKYVLLGQRWIGYPARELEYLDAAVVQIIAAGSTPLILGPVAEDGTDKKACFYSNIKLRRTDREDCSIDRRNAFALESKAYVTNLFQRIHAKYPSVIFVDPQAVQCQGEHCTAAIDSAPIYDDTHHLNGFGANALAHLYLESIGNPLLRASGEALPRKPQ